MVFRAASSSGAGSGTVTSVGLDLPDLFTISNSPVTTAGTLTGVFAVQSANYVFAGPVSGASATPAMRPLVNADLPTLIVPTVDGTVTGPSTAAFNCGYTSSAVGDLVYLDSSATWQKCDANTLALYNGMLGIAMEVKAAAAALLVALPGSMVYATAFPTLTIGSPIYMSETPGAVTQTAPVTADSATRVVGWAVHADKVFFMPSSDYITHT